MGKGLGLNGANSSTPDGLPILFLDDTTYATATTTIGQNPSGAGWWPAATSATATDPDCNITGTGCYQLIGPHVFRFEYYYILPNGAFSAGPWTGAISYDMSQVSNPPVGTPALKDISAIVVAIEVIDDSSKVILSNSGPTYQLSTL